MKRFDGKLSLSYPRGSGDPVVRIDITDSKSGCLVMEVEISYEEFTAALSSLAARPCKGTIYTDAPIGQKREVAEMLVETPIDHYAWSDAEKAELLAPYEKDGWKGRPQDLGNPHRRYVNKGLNGYNVTFIRFVPDTE